jgi:hypothetical protein
MPAKKVISVLPGRVPSEAGVCARRAVPVKLSIKRLSAKNRKIRELLFILALSPYDAV